MSILSRFFISHGISAFAGGIHIVMLSWLALAVVHVSSFQLGLIQVAALLPSLVTMLVSGAWADRRNPFLVLTASLVFQGAVYGALTVCAALNMLSLKVLLVYAVCIGLSNGCVQPLKEKIVSDIRAVTLQKRVSFLSFIQFSMQSAGILLAGISDSVGVHWVLLIQAGAVLIAAACTLSLRRTHTKPASYRSVKESTLQSIRSGVRAVRHNRAFRHLMLLVAFNGFMHMGIFIVLMPMLAREHYGFHSAAYSTLQCVFVLGMIVAHGTIGLRKTIVYPGQGALFSLLYTAVIGFSLSQAPTTLGFYSLVFLWGLVAGNSAAQCRLVLLSVVAKPLKGRAISMYQALLFGMAPLGALVTGWVIDYADEQQVLDFMAMASAVLFLFFMFSRTLWKISQNA